MGSTIKKKALIETMYVEKAIFCILWYCDTRHVYSNLSERTPLYNTSLSMKDTLIFP